MKVKEYPEKDSINKRVFRARKVACAILLGQRSPRSEGNTVSVEVYPDANSQKPEFFGKITYESCFTLDSRNIPLILMDEWQERLAAKIGSFDCQTLSESSVREGELNESTSKEAVFDQKKSGTLSIYGTNRMEFFYFNFFPKQDIVQFCKLSDASITAAKRKDYEKPRVAINGIAGTNDSRVLCSSYLPSETLVNSNINYVLVSDLSGKGIETHYYIALLNSMVFDKLIRIQKKTSHNSSAMIASLPIVKSTSEAVNPESILGKKKWTIDEIVSPSADGKSLFKSSFVFWLSELSKLLLETGILKNEKIHEVYSSLVAVTKLDRDQQNTLARKIGDASLSVEELILQNGLRGQAAKKLKDDTKDGLDFIKQILQIESRLSSYLNYNIAFGFLGSAESAKKFLESYKLSVDDNWNSLRELHEQLNDIDTTPFVDYAPWKEAIGA